jgi:tRNA(Ile)-lysidine synthase
VPLSARGRIAGAALSQLRNLPLALQRRVIRAAAESVGLSLEFRHVEEIISMLSDHSGAAKASMLPDGWMVSRSTHELRFQPSSDTQTQSDYGYCLPVPGIVRVPETQSCFEALLVRGSVDTGYNPEHLLERTSVGQELRVRNWHPGDRFWPAHTKDPKKIKELLQELHVSGPQRKLWPVVVCGSDLVWVRGFSVPARWQPRDGSEEAVLIRELPVREDFSYGNSIDETHDEI